MKLRNPRLMLDEAVRHHKAGRLAEAQSLYRSVIAGQPRNSAALRLLGLSLHQQGRLDEAIAEFRRAIAAQRDNPDAWRNLGVALQEKGEVGAAIEAYESALTWRRDYAEAFRNLGNAFGELKRWEEAEAAQREAIRLKPDYAEAHTNLGSALQETGKTEEAIAAHQHALALAPRLAAAHNNLGYSLLCKGEYRTAIRVLKRAVGLRRDYAEAHSNLGAAHAALGQKKEADAELRLACRLDPRSARCLVSLGVFLQQYGEYDEALAIHARAAEQGPASVDPHFNMAGIHAARGDHGKAVAAFRGAVAAQPEDSDAHFALGLHLLGTGDYVEGFREYEWRRRAKSHHPRRYDQPEWKGEDVRGRQVFLHHEQGLGDALQFVRFAEVLRRHGARVRLEVHAPLRAIVAQAFPEISVFAAPEPPGEFAVHAPLMSVPHYLGLAREDIGGGAYLSALPERVQAWRDQLPQGINVGIVWQGNPQGLIDRGRSIPLAEFAPLAGIKGVNLISLQKNFGLDQLDDLPAGMTVHRLPPEFDAGPDAFLDTAGLMESLDLVVTSDTSVAHVAGALGRPTFLILKHAPDWRWGLQGERTAWYDSMSLFRQRHPGIWADAFGEAATALRRIMQG